MVGMVQDSVRKILFFKKKKKKTHLKKNSKFFKKKLLNFFSDTILDHTYHLQKEFFKSAQQFGHIILHTYIHLEIAFSFFTHLLNYNWLEANIIKI